MATSPRDTGVPKSWKRQEGLCSLGGSRALWYHDLGFLSCRICENLSLWVYASLKSMATPGYSHPQEALHPQCHLYRMRSGHSTSCSHVHEFRPPPLHKHTATERSGAQLNIGIKCHIYCYSAVKYRTGLQPTFERALCKNSRL